MFRIPKWRMTPRIMRSPNRWYNQRNQFIQSAVLNSQLSKPKGLPLKTIGLLIASSSTLTMGLYVFIQLWRHKEDEATTVFLPLWFRSNWISNKLAFPTDLKYLDDDTTLENVIGTDFQQFQEVNIKYSLLEELAQNSTVKSKLGFPLLIKPKDFKIWIELNHPSVLGVKIIYQEKSFKGVGWCIKPLNINSLAKDILTQVMDHMESTSPNNEIHAIKLPKKDYSIAFSGTMTFEEEQADCSYTGFVDFNHLGINKGIKISSIEMKLYEDSLVYKIV